MTKSRDVKNENFVYQYGRNARLPTHKKSWNITPIYATHQVTQQMENRKG